MSKEKAKSMCLDCFEEWESDPLVGILIMNCPKCGSENCGVVGIKPEGDNKTAIERIGDE